MHDCSAAPRVITVTLTSLYPKDENRNNTPSYSLVHTVGRLRDIPEVAGREPRQCHRGIGFGWWRVLLHRKQSTRVHQSLWPATSGGQSSHSRNGQQISSGRGKCVAALLGPWIGGGGNSMGQRSVVRCVYVYVCVCVCVCLDHQLMSFPS